MTLSLRLINISLLSSCLLLQGCHSVKKTLGMEREAPDEFAVTPCTQPLDMPPDFFNLPPPQPGVPRPQEVQALQVEREKLFGSVPTNRTSSPGQKALLEKAGAEKGQHKVRKEINEEAHAESLKDNPLLKTLGIKQPKGHVVNPLEEASHLQNQGIPGPQAPQSPDSQEAPEGGDRT